MNANYEYKVEKASAAKRAKPFRKRLDDADILTDRASPRLHTLTKGKPFKLHDVTKHPVVLFTDLL